MLSHSAKEESNVRQGMSRREFLTASAVAGLSLAAAGRLGAEETMLKTKLYKAMICGKPSEGELEKLKAAGFHGVETGAWNLPPAEAEQCRKAAEKVGMKIQSVLRGWMEFNSKDPAVVAKSVAETETALRAAEGFGADAVLLVPCRIGGMPMPEAWDFDIEFDPTSGHLKRVVQGDNEKYKAYIEAHDQAVDGSVAAVRKLIPVAEKTKVVIESMGMVDLPEKKAAKAQGEAKASIDARVNRLREEYEEAASKLKDLTAPQVRKAG